MRTITIALLLAAGISAAQTPAQERKENADRTAAGLTPIYRVSVTERTIKAVSYQHRSGATKIDFRGTDLMPKARGEAKVESKKGYIEVEVEFDNLQEPTQFGAEYLTYVLWAITPEGRTANLGEILRGNGTKGKLDVTTELQAFGLVITAEPYFAVSRPSDVIVMENVLRPDTLGKVELIDAKYELLQRGQYQHLANVQGLKMDSKIPLEVYEARNAIQIARTSGADRYATDTFQKAEGVLKQSDVYRVRKAGTKPVIMTARQAVQVAEDARAIAVKRQDEDILARERQAGADRELRAENSRDAAQAESDRVTRQAASARLSAQAEADRVKRDTDAQAANALTTANRLRQDNAAQAASAKAEADRVKRASDATLVAAQTEAARLRSENDAKLAAADVESARLARENDAQRASAQASLDRATSDNQKLEKERVELRSALLLQFNTILQTRDTARGLIVNMSDVIFDTGKSSLLPGAREKLAKVAGIISGHPGLSLEVEGHTDSVGTNESNQILSERRGESVRDYLLKQGMAVGSVSSKGFGEEKPVASNDTAAGRQQNRRVEIVISGDIIGKEIGVPLAAR